jgi:hypothetical protein
MYNLLLPLITLVIISFVFLHFNAKNKMLKQQLKSIQNEINNKQEFTQPPEQPIQQTQQNDPITDRDYRIVYDPLAPASQRPPNYVFPPERIRQYIDIPTRGAPDNYQYLGNLIRTTDEKVIKLFGRQRFPRSEQYEYYGIASDGSNIGIKVPIENNNYKEIYDGDLIDVPYFNVANGKFKVQMFPDQTFRYNPYVL